MKTILMTLALTQTLMTTSNAAENLKWAQGPFWKAPQNLAFNRKMVSADKSLPQACEEYSALVNRYKKFPLTGSIATTVDVMRTESLYPMQTVFKGTFDILDIPVSNYIENETVTEGEAANEILPMFTQTHSFTGINLNNVGDIEIESTEDSLVAFSRKLNLVDSAAQSTRRMGKFAIETNGLDLACDLLNRKAILKASSPSFVRITKEASEEMSNFYYYKLSPQIQDVLARTDSPTIRAARLGFRLGKVLEEKNGDRVEATVTEKQIGNLIDRLFFPKTLNPSELIVTGIENKKVIDFTSSLKGENAILELRM